MSRGWNLPASSAPPLSPSCSSIKSNEYKLAFPPGTGGFQRSSSHFLLSGKDRFKRGRLLAKKLSKYDLFIPTYYAQQIRLRNLSRGQACPGDMCAFTHANFPLPLINCISRSPFPLALYSPIDCANDQTIVFRSCRVGPPSSLPGQYVDIADYIGVTRHWALFIAQRVAGGILWSHRRGRLSRQ